MTGRKLLVSSLLVLGGLVAVAIYMMSGPRPSADQVEAPSAVAGASAAAADLTIDQHDKQFSRERVTVNAGDRIKFVNDDKVSHNVFVTGPGVKTRNSGVQEPGESTTLVFDAPGTYGVQCGIYPEMRMTVEVK